MYIPCSAFNFAQTWVIAKNIRSQIRLMLPGHTTTEVSVVMRATKLYLEPNQNDHADAVAAPYSVRPHTRQWDQKKPQISKSEVFIFHLTWMSQILK